MIQACLAFVQSLGLAQWLTFAGTLKAFTEFTR
jgi:hypothetical protein